MTTLMIVRVSAVVALGLTAVLTGCAPTADPSGSPAVITVPGTFPTIQQAVDSAAAGDLVLVSDGTYSETVSITTPEITLRGESRGGVVIDGGVRRANGVVVSAPAVTLQNFTVRGATQNGVLVTGMRDDDGQAVGGHDGYTPLDTDDHPLLEGFRIDHVTATNNGLYGIYAFNSSGGVIENSYASGSADSGIYVGQCKPCNIVVRDNIAELNAVGFEIANAGGDLFVVGNRFVGNRVGATINSDYQEAYLPQAGVTFAGNLVGANAQPSTPEQAEGGYGIGIGIGGGTENLVSHNLVMANPGSGIVMTSSEDLGPVANRIERNSLVGNGVDLAYAPSDRGPGRENCWRDNEASSASPAILLQGTGCDGEAIEPGAISIPPAPPGIAFTDVQAPPVQPAFDGPSPAPRPWTVDDVPLIDIGAILTPDSGLLAASARVGL